MADRTVTATELKTRLGAYLDAAQTGPVFIEKSGRPSHVLLSRAQYEQLLVYEDFWWGQRAQRAEAEGYVGEHETKAAFQARVREGAARAEAMDALQAQAQDLDMGY